MGGLFLDQISPSLCFLTTLHFFHSSTYHPVLIACLLDCLPCQTINFYREKIVLFSVLNFACPQYAWHIVDHTRPHTDTFLGNEPLNVNEEMHRWQPRCTKDIVLENHHCPLAGVHTVRVREQSEIRSVYKETFPIHPWLDAHPCTNTTNVHLSQIQIDRKLKQLKKIKENSVFMRKKGPSDNKHLISLICLFVYLFITYPLIYKGFEVACEITSKTIEKYKK